MEKRSQRPWALPLAGWVALKYHGSAQSLTFHTCAMGMVASPVELCQGPSELMAQMRAVEVCVLIITVIQDEEDGRAASQPMDQAAAGNPAECQLPRGHG